MTTIRTPCVAILVTLSALTATVQAQPATAASISLAGANTAQDCAKPMAKHDHGEEKGTPTPTATATSAPCAVAAAASGPAAVASSAKKPGHNHSTFHKTM